MCGTAFSHPYSAQARRASAWVLGTPRSLAPLRIAVVGKGGVGKTTISGALCRVLDAQGLRVLAIDADPDANFASALPLAPGAGVTPLARQTDLLRKKAAENVAPGLFLLNPDTSDLLQRGSVRWGNGQTLVSIGWAKAGGEGCYCAENAVVKRLLAQATRQHAEVTVVDSEAGLEHLSRGTIAAVDIVLVVIEPGRRSVETAQAVRKLAADLQIAHVFPVLSAYRDAREQGQVRDWLGDWAPLASFPFDERVRQADLDGTLPPCEGEFRLAAEELAVRLLQLGHEKNLAV